MVESRTVTKRIYTCDMGRVMLREEDASVVIELIQVGTAMPEKLEEFSKLLHDVAVELEDLCT